MIKPKRNITMITFFLTLAAIALTTLTQAATFAQKQSTGFVFALTNVAEENEVVIFSRAADGTLTLQSRVSTRGNGIGSPLDSQGALILNEDNTRLYACNPGSDEISVFETGPIKPNLIQKIHSGGDLPVSLTIHDKLLYVLDAGSGSNIFGFQVRLDGTLFPIAGSFRRLTNPIGAPAEIAFNPAGNVLVVTHKATDVLRPPQNIIDTFTVGTDGLPSLVMTNASNGIRPFGFAFRADGVMVVSEAFNDVPNDSASSSYQVFANGSIQVISGSVKNMQTASCWVAITNDGRFAFVANTLSGTISSYSVAADGSLTLINGVAATTGMNSLPFDMDLSADGRYLYALLSGAGQVAAFRIEANGSLTPLGNAGGIPAMAGATGLAAF